MKPWRVWTLLDRAFPERRMRRAWNRRARRDSRLFIAGGHAETEERFWSSGERDLDELVLRDVGVSGSADVLEIGCGVGRLLRPLAARVHRAFGVDVSDEMVERARQTLAGIANAEVRRADGRLEAFPDASLDLVISFLVFQHVPSKRIVSSYVREAARVLKSGGVFRFQVDGRPRWRLSSVDTWRGVWFTAAEIRGELVACGFEVAGLWGEGTQYLWVTASRASEPGRTQSAAVALLPRAWDRAALGELIGRLGGRAEDDTEAIVRGERSLRSAAAAFLRREKRSRPGDFVRRAYEVVLGREPDPAGLEFYRREIRGGVARENTVDCLLASAELEDRLRPRVQIAAS